MNAKTSDNRRQRKVAETIRAELAMLLVKHTRDPNLAFVNLTGLDLSPDLKNARVYYTTFGTGDAEKAGLALRRAAPFFQREIAKSVNMRYTPTLRFVYDQSIQEASQIDDLILETTRDALTQNETTVEQKVARTIADARSILLCVHKNPDGDATGSLFGMTRILTLLGKTPVVYCPGGVPAFAATLPGAGEAVAALQGDETFDVSILMDTGGLSQIPSDFPDVKRRGVFVVIDHHSQFDPFGDLVIRRDSSSVGELLFSLSRELMWPIDKDAAICLYTALVADTGSFRYDNTRSRTHLVAAELIELGAMPWETATALFESNSLARQRLLGATAKTVTLSPCGRLSTMVCTLEMIANAGAQFADLDGIINFGRSIEGVEIALLFTQSVEGSIKVGFRSSARADVAHIAKQFSGGGHPGASGATLENTTLEDAVERVSAACLAHLNSPDKG